MLHSEVSEHFSFFNSGELDQAKKELDSWVEEFQKEKFEIGSKDPLLDQLLVDLTDSLEIVKGTSYNAYEENELGVRMQVSGIVIKCALDQSPPNVNNALWQLAILGTFFSAMFRTPRKEQCVSHSSEVNSSTNIQ